MNKTYITIIIAALIGLFAVGSALSKWADEQAIRMEARQETIDSMLGSQ